jgi:hypothetical protein
VVIEKLLFSAPEARNFQRMPVKAVNEIYERQGRNLKQNQEFFAMLKENISQIQGLSWKEVGSLALAFNQIEAQIL